MDLAFALDDVRVVDFSTGVAGPYATHLLRDMGAAVLKIEPPSGDPLRAWSASGRRPADQDGALFCFLNGGKRSICGGPGDPEVIELIGDADIVIESGQLSDDDIKQLRERFPHLVNVSVTPFGRSGAWARRPATEFTLQALCGSTASRGSTDRPPVAVGGRLGEWISGTYAAVAALAFLAGGRGDHVDVSMLECMCVTMGGYGHLYASLAGQLPKAAEYRGPVRSVESPSVEPTSDGLVGFCTVTAQQFADLAAMIGHPDLGDDPRFQNAGQRIINQREFAAILHGWTTKHTTAEIIELASLLRVPVAPIGRPSTIGDLDHFVDRRVYVDNPMGFRQPRTPHSTDGLRTSPPSPAPQLGEDSGYTWPARIRPSRVPQPVGEPLADIRVVDLTAFWAGPAATNIMAALGADVIKVESAKRPDGMRFTTVKPPGDDGWWEWSMVYQGVNANKRGLTLDLDQPTGRELLLTLIETADVVIDNFSPRVMDSFGLTWEVVHARNPRAIMVRMPAFGLDGPWRDRTGFAQTMEQTSGMAWITGYPDGPPLIPRGACDPTAGMHALAALLAALHERESSGVGRFVEVPMIETALNTAAELMIEYSAYGVELMRDGNRSPVAAPQGLYACAGREAWLALAVESDAQWQALSGVLGYPAWMSDDSLSTDDGRRAHHDRLDELLSAALEGRDVDDLVEILVAAGVSAARVVAPAAVPQLAGLRTRRFIEEIDGPVVGRHEVFGIPFRAASRVELQWFETPAPTLGQHNREVLEALLGLDITDIDKLGRDGVIGDRLHG
ncbi:CaiB/BaiF CoA transferase family protein [Mycobacterium sp. NPDC051804]|uniref:CaiB/BaiF CoA transferase family protein n=1 Tax=Mycobacterium sp. NPDC051804 TaxID=3364295 RepID=UPI00378C461F